MTAPATAKIIFDAFVGFGFTPAQACGMVAQADAESSFRPMVVGDHGEAHGLFQLHADRIALIKAGCGADMAHEPDPFKQCLGVWWEMTKGHEKHALAAIRAATTAYDAGAAACRFYERPGAPGQPAKRGALAQAWFARFTPHTEAS